MKDGAGESVEPGDFQGVASAEHPQHEVELRTGRLRATGAVKVDVLPVHTLTEEGVDLVVGGK